MTERANRLKNRYIQKENIRLMLEQRALDFAEKLKQRQLEVEESKLMLEKHFKELETSRPSKRKKRKQPRKKESFDVIEIIDLT